MKVHLSLIATVGTKYRSILRAKARYLNKRERDRAKRKEKEREGEKNKDERRFNFWLLKTADDVIFLQSEIT